MQRVIHMRKITLLVAAVAALVLIGIGTWRIGGRTSAPTSALATDQSPVIMTGAKGSPTALYDDYEIVVY
jgi:hypothetical protein